MVVPKKKFTLVLIYCSVLVPNTSMEEKSVFEFLEGFAVKCGNCSHVRYQRYPYCGTQVVLYRVFSPLEFLKIMEMDQKV
jgi:hypothetical protein